MRLLEKIAGEKARQLADMLPPFGPRFERGIINRLETLHVHCSEMSDPGADFCQFEGFDADGQLIGTMRFRGY